MKDTNDKELPLLKTIKAQFGWPVDLLRYGFTFEIARFIDANGGLTETLDDEITKKIGYSLTKLKRVQQYLPLFRLMPWVEAVYITGSVASLNADQDDDIDIWLITEHRRIWLSRALEFLMFGIMGKRRFSVHQSDSPAVSDLLCFNMYTDVTHLSFETHNPSYAMQFVDAIPLYVRQPSLLRQLVEENAWIADFFPHWYSATKRGYAHVLPYEAPIRNALVNAIFDVLEYIAGVLMLLKAKRRLILSPKNVFVSMFTTWGTPRILAPYEETQSKSS